MPSGEFTKSVGKQLCWSLVFNKITGRLNKRLRQCSSRLLCSFSVLYVHSRNNWNFSRKVQKVCFPNNRTHFTVLLAFKPWRQVMLISPAIGRNSSYLDYIDKVFMHITNIAKIRNFLRSFPVKFSLFKQGSLTLLV